MTPATRSRTAAVLLVEDDASLRDLYRATLTSAGYAVFSVEDGVDALRYLESHTPAAVVLDLGLPRLHGRDVHREMRSQPRTQNIPVIVVTGNPDTVNAYDFDCVLQKPIDTEALLTAVHRCLTSASR